MNPMMKLFAVLVLITSSSAAVAGSTAASFAFSSSASIPAATPVVAEQEGWPDFDWGHDDPPWKWRLSETNYEYCVDGCDEVRDSLFMQFGVALKRALASCPVAPASEREACRKELLEEIGYLRLQAEEEHAACVAACSFALKQ
ncbi:MAG: hypothetical protein AB7F66_04725 [Bacteriovoracia bacterium]